MLSLTTATWELYCTVLYCAALYCTVLQVGSYIHDNTQISFTGAFDHDVEHQRAQQYVLTAMELDVNDTFIIHANRFVVRCY